MSKKTKINFSSKTETLEEYLKRGGIIKQVPVVNLAPPQEITRTSQHNGPAVLLTLEEADLFFGEPVKKKPKKAKPQLKIDLDVLPAALRAKFIAKLEEQVDGEGYEESFKEIKNRT